MREIKYDVMAGYLTPYIKQIEETAKVCFRLSIDHFSSLNTSNQLGGHPLLDPYCDIPKDSNGENMLLLAQIDFHEIKLPFPFPKEGILQFYVNINFGNPTISTVNEQFAINFLNNKSNTLKTSLLIPKQKLTCIPTPLKFTGSVIYEPVSAFDYQFNYHFTNIQRIISPDEQSFHDIYMQYFLGAEHKIGGYPYFLKEDFRLKNTSLQKYDTLLLQIISDDLYNIEYRDSGIISFFIEQDKLLKLDFSDVYMHTEHY